MTIHKSCAVSCYNPSDVLQSLTVQTALPEDGADERRNAMECQSNSVTWCMTTDGALSVGLMKAK